MENRENNSSVTKDPAFLVESVFDWILYIEIPDQQRYRANEQGEAGGNKEQSRGAVKAE